MQPSLRLVAWGLASLLMLQNQVIAPHSHAAALGESLGGLDSLPTNSSCVAPARPTTGQPASLDTVVGSWVGGSVILTVMLQHPDDPTQWIIGDRSGVFYRYREGSPMIRVGLFADLRDRVIGAHTGDMGLLAAVLHPDFTHNHELFLLYTASGTPYSVRLSRFVSRDGGLTLDPATEQILLSVSHDTVYHKGGLLLFGADGYLYVGLGEVQ